MILVLTPNPAVDVTYTVGHQLIGETQRVLDVAKRPGGKGLNVARVLHLLGRETLALSPLGGDGGRWIESELEASGIANTSSLISAPTRTTVTVVDADQHPTVFAEPGPTISPTEWEDYRGLVREHLPAADLVVVSGSLPATADSELVAEWVADAHARGVPILVDVSGPPLLAAARAGADIVKPNAAELREATGNDDESVAAHVLLDLGAGLVIVSRGADGLTAYSTTEVTTVEAVPGVAGNPTGAGDAATAGTAVGFVDGIATVDLLRLASALGAAAVLRPTAGDIDLDAYPKFIAHLELSGAKT
ncbi:hypothetical protein AX769_17605 [Frondihabitans sp. PAMC 28766]|uniref:1-phosphofructokinase family hexose kinase n=1 Tax=Frondihabitans sp. PAMC 28766 TaxID=1795630 RepID=UPI00078CE643|nr:hexose kinase [Frondihabitans sp. PAMC 28766]AMM21623.1 hypothetical protein AX769_17605 [Frondihabitans sp. PAMC 28766]